MHGQGVDSMRLERARRSGVPPEHLPGHRHGDCGAIVDQPMRELTRLGQKVVPRNDRTQQAASRASSAGMRPAVYHHSSAFSMPTMRGRNHVEHASGTMPIRPKTNPIRAPSAGTLVAGE